tara:strand:- start:690 stop:1463 length:774 start_codon:yes stop_codon:yes gene_type:complete
MSRILGISGAKQSGKSTCMKFLHGYQLRFYDVIEKFLMDENGDIFVNAKMINENGEEEDTVAILDVERRDPEFLEWASTSIWPFIKCYSFADPLKMIAIQLFGLTEDQCFGTDEDKNTPVNLKWEDMPVGYYGTESELNKGFMTAREFLQYFGTNICRQMKANVWTEACVNRMLAESPEIAIVPDVRFPNEVEAIQKAGGQVIRLTRRPFDDSHSSETALDDYDGFDYVLDNSELSIDETNRKLLEIMKEWQWLKTK